MDRDTALETLEVSADATRDEVVTAYRLLLKVWHPDRFPEGSQLHAVATERAQELNEAFRVLTASGRDLSVLKMGVIPEPEPGGIASADHTRDPLLFGGAPAPRTSPAGDRTRWRGLAIGFAVSLTLVGVVSLSSDRLPLPTDAEAAAGHATPVVSAPETSMPAGPPSTLEAAPAAAPAGPSTAAARRMLAPYSVTVGSFADASRANSVLQRLRDPASGVWATLAPVRVGGVVYQRVVVGLERSEQGLADVIDKAARALETDPGGWISGEAGIAVCLGESSWSMDLRDTLARAERAGVAPYVLQTFGNDGQLLFRVYAGSYPSVGEAQHLLSTLRSAGFDAQTCDRVGVPSGRADLSVGRTG